MPVPNSVLSALSARPLSSRRCAARASLAAWSTNEAASGSTSTAGEAWVVVERWGGLVGRWVRVGARWMWGEAGPQRRPGLRPAGNWQTGEAVQVAGAATLDVVDVPNTLTQPKTTHSHAPALGGRAEAAPAPKEGGGRGGCGRRGGPSASSAASRGSCSGVVAACRGRSERAERRALTWTA